MKRLVHGSLSLVLAAMSSLACSAGSVDDPGPGPGPGPDGGGPGPGGGTYVLQGTLVESMELSGVVQLADDATIAAGTSLVLKAGSELQGAQGKTLTVLGSLTFQGTADAKIHLGPDAGSSGWGGISVGQGGTLVMQFIEAQTGSTIVNCGAGAVSCTIEDSHFKDVDKAVVFNAPGSISRTIIEQVGNGGVSVATGADLTVTDTLIRASSHDVVVQNGGKLAMDHVQIGEPGTYIHCGLHISSADSFSMTNSLITSNVYGYMLYGGTGHVITGNNFVANTTTHMDVAPGVTANLSGNYWEGGLPNFGGQQGLNTSGSVAQPIANVGPRL